MSAATITQQAEYIERQRDDAQGRLVRAADEGSALAAAVYEYVEHPEDVGLDSLRHAYSRFMGHHSGNFSS
jgi:hypothetical protein